MSRASKQAMDALHVQIATVLTDEIANFTKPKIIKDAEGKDVEVAPDKRGLSALMNVARQFLKDNEVTALGVPDSPLKSLADSLPFAGSEFSGGEEDSPVH